MIPKLLFQKCFSTLPVGSYAILLPTYIGKVASGIPEPVEWCFAYVDINFPFSFVILLWKFQSLNSIPCYQFVCSCVLILPSAPLLCFRKKLCVLQACSDLKRNLIASGQQEQGYKIYCGDFCETPRLILLQFYEQVGSWRSVNKDVVNGFL